MDTDRVLERLRELHPNASIARVAVEGDVVRIFCARPGILMGKRAANLGVLKPKLDEWFGRPMQLALVEVRAELEPLLVAETVLAGLLRGVDIARAGGHIALCKKRGGECRIEVHGALGDHVFAEPDVARQDSPHATLRGMTPQGEVQVDVWVALVPA